MLNCILTYHTIESEELQTVAFDITRYEITTDGEDSTSLLTLTLYNNNDFISNLESLILSRAAIFNKVAINRDGAEYQYTSDLIIKNLVRYSNSASENDAIAYISLIFAV